MGAAALRQHGIGLLRQPLVLAEMEDVVAGALHLYGEREVPPQGDEIHPEGTRGTDHEERILQHGPVVGLLHRIARLDHLRDGLAVPGQKGLQLAFVNISRRCHSQPDVRFATGYINGIRGSPKTLPGCLRMLPQGRQQFV